MIVGLLIVVVLAWVAGKFIHLGNVKWTDNAQVKQLIIPVNSRVQGFISEVRFDDFQEVKKGDTLAIIEDTEFRYRLAQAEADYQNALKGQDAMNTSSVTMRNNISVSESAVNEAKIRLDNAEREYIRHKNLFEQEAITKQQYDAVQTNYEAQKARYELLVRQKESTSLASQEQGHRVGQTVAVVQLAAAAVELAKLNLSYTVIVAPCDGTLGRKNIQEGQLIQPGQSIVDIVDANEIWVMANYKETQTANIAVGNEVELTVDAVPGVVYKGRVEKISRATGASFSLLPQDNSSGNFVKIEQRISVRIAFSEENSNENMTYLRSGMNVECEVKKMRNEELGINCNLYSVLCNLNNYVSSSRRNTKICYTTDAVVGA